MTNYAKLGDLKAGDKIVVDGGFTCLEAHSVHEVKAAADDGGMLYIDCKDGYHYLDGQLDALGSYIGITKLDDVAPDADKQRAATGEDENVVPLRKPSSGRTE